MDEDQMLMGYDELIYARQEEMDEPSDIYEEDCTYCKLLNRCRDAAAGKGEFPNCPNCRNEY